MQNRYHLSFLSPFSVIQALELAADFDGGDLQIQWAASRRESQSDVVPDEERAVEHRVTPAALLASIGTIEVGGSFPFFLPKPFFSFFLT